MNMFILDNCPFKAAQLNCDTHTSKIILEIAQMLCIPFHLNGIQNVPYKMCHKNHPVSKWVRESYENFTWTVRHAHGLHFEKAARTSKGHKSIDVVKWAASNMDLISLPRTGLTKFAIAINENSLCRKYPSFDESDPVKCYQLYYKYDKKDIAKWTKREVPEFML
jgi:hypothetical protein